MDIGRLRLLAAMRVFWAFLWLTELASRGPALTSERADSLWQPLFMARWFDTPPAGHYVAFIQLVSALATSLLLLGLVTRITGPVAVASGILFMSLGMSWGKVGHTTQAVLLVGLVLSLSDWGRCWSADALVRRLRGRPLRVLKSEWADWPFWTATFVLALLYVNSGLHKLARGYFLDGGFESFLRYRVVQWSGDERVPEWTFAMLRWVVDRPLAVDVLAYGSVLFEAGFVLALLSPRLRLLFLCGAFAFHGSIGVLSGVYFTEPMMMALLILVPTAVLLFRDRVRFLKRLFPAEPLPIGESRARVPAWAVVAMATASALLLLLLVEPLIPGWLSLEAGRGWARLVTLHSRNALIPTTPRAFAILALLGSVAVGLALGAMAWRTLRHRPLLLLERWRAWSGSTSGF